MLLQWCNQFWQSLEAGAGKWCSECGCWVLTGVCADGIVVFILHLGVCSVEWRMRSAPPAGSALRGRAASGRDERGSGAGTSAHAAASCSATTLSTSSHSPPPSPSPDNYDHLFPFCCWFALVDVVLCQKFALPYLFEAGTAMRAALASPTSV